MHQKEPIYGISKELNFFINPLNMAYLVKIYYSLENPYIGSF